MIDIPAALQARLDAGATTLAWCWIITRRDGAVLGFTDHDAPLNVAGTACEPESGFSPGAARSEAAFSPARAAVFGALTSERISAADIDNGVWDSARVEVYRVDWSEPGLFYKAFTGEIGAVKRGETGFEAEVAGLSARLDRLITRVFSRTCDAELGDGRCGVDLEAGGWRDAASVTAVISSRAVQISGVEARPADWFTDGVAEWSSGANQNGRSRILSHRPGDAGAVIELDPSPSAPVQPGDTLILTAGCNKRFATCQAKFANVNNFRGCPHMPGNDVLVRPVSRETVRDGSRR
ncbi:MAG: DUF2163 domain-containing protein [Alphaproteobacteria bacterium]|nr:DUF2163 domain-containing protein [Alphaproteobacteria bacterium]